MKTRKEGSKARLLGLSCMALVLTAFGVTGVRADAADAKKAPPLVNLAEEKDVTFHFFTISLTFFLFRFKNPNAQISPGTLMRENDMYSL